MKQVDEKQRKNKMNQVEQSLRRRSKDEEEVEEEDE
jgi:hypothetical protein